jgi:hypothetical protein
MLSVLTFKVLKIDSFESIPEIFADKPIGE